MLGDNEIYWLSYVAAVKGNGLILFNCCIQQWNKTQQMNTHTRTHTCIYIQMWSKMIAIIVLGYYDCTYLMAKYEDCRVGKVMIPLKDVFSEYI